MKHTIYALTMFALAACTSPKEKAIDRHALVTRNNPEVTAMDSLSSLSVGNGEFAYTVDATGLQTFPEVYKNGVPLGTQSQWGWHSFGNPENYKPEEALVEYDFGHGHKELYATQPKEPGSPGLHFSCVHSLLFSIQRMGGPFYIPGLVFLLLIP